MSGTTAPERYLVGGAPALLAQLAAAAGADPGVELIDVKGPPEAPTALVVAMDAARADALRVQYGSGLVVEHDAAL